MFRMILPFFFLFLFSSCIGQIDDANPKDTKGAEVSSTFIQYEGIIDAIPISHNKVDIFFGPSSGDADGLTYLISYDGALTSKSVRGSNLRPDYRGLLKYTFTDLDPDTKYFFRVQVKNKAGERSDSAKYITTSTFINKTADFAGISAVESMPGAEGINSAKILWPEGTVLGTPQSPKETDIVSYVVTLIQADALTPSEFDNESFGEPIRKVYYVNSQKVDLITTGLQAGTRYYARVRAIHHGYLENNADSSYKAEQNSKYIQFSTLSNDLGEVDFDPSQLLVKLNESSNGRAVNLNWGVVKGAFDHFRIYYNKLTDGSFSSYLAAKDASCSGRETGNPAFLCKSVGYDAFEATIVDLEPFVDYEINVLVCQDFECSNFIRYDRKLVSTDIQLVSFGGIKDIKLASDISELGAVILEYDVPDISVGGLDGFLIEVSARTTGEPAFDTIINNPLSSNNVGMDVVPYSIGSGEVIVTGVNYFSPEQYCFSMSPYIYINGEVKYNSTGKVTKCIQPELVTPTEDEFLGVSGLSIDPMSKFVEIQWAPPIGGLFSHYYLFVKLGGGFFTFGEAVGTDPSYLRYKLPAWQTRMTLMLPAGSYSAGVLTYLNLNGGYSDFNSSIVFFDVD